MIKFRFNEGYEQKLSMIKRLPKLVAKATFDDGRKAAAQVIANFQDGIKMNNFHLRPLKPGTVKGKRRMQMTRPKVPLYGLGEENKDSYVNALFVAVHQGKTRTTYVIGASSRKHHPPVRIARSGKRKLARSKASKQLPLSKLIRIHEHGAFIRHGKGVIIIPPRPAVRMAWERMLKQRRGKTKAVDMRKALAEAIQKSKTTRLREMSRFTARERKILDRRG